MSDPNNIFYYVSQSYNWDLSRSQSIPSLLLDHLYITGLTMLIALIIAFPLALLAVRYQRLYLPTITSAGVLYTLPALAVMPLLIPFTGLTVLTVVIPLVAYAQVVLIRNIVAAIHAVDPTLLEVGRAMGMSETQLLWRVTLPLALPVIIAGVRIATVTTIGIATIGPLVGVQDLGSIITGALDTLYAPQLITGAVLITMVALFFDLGLLGLQRVLDRGRTTEAARS